MKRVVAALIVRQDRLLVCQRTAGQPMPLKWEFPGGKVESGEQPDEALRRELQEELGIDASVGEEVACLEHRYGDPPQPAKTGLAGDPGDPPQQAKTGLAGDPGEDDGLIELRFFLVKIWQGEIVNRIFREVRWARRDELPGYDFLEADLRLVRDIAKGKVIDLGSGEGC